MSICTGASARTFILMEAYLARVNHREFDPDLAGRRVARSRQLTQHDVNITILRIQRSSNQPRAPLNRPQPVGQRAAHARTDVNFRLFPNTFMSMRRMPPFSHRNVQPCRVMRA